ncbi:hypothetical protein [Gynuella sunshinyii]|uniref:hypothetical protein n=1 Tax=Gynuella sunshinyii TaxID=1445505 RepID=UPI0011872657|nr:hypothetical protein [Gynuella sunshinyii]
MQNVIDSGKGFSLFLQDSKTGKFSGLYASNQAFKDTIDINFSAERLAADYEFGGLEFQASSISAGDITEQDIAQLLKEYYQGDIERLMQLSSGDLTDVDQRVIGVSEQQLEYFNSHVQREGFNAEMFGLTPNLANLGEAFGYLDRGWFNQRTVFPGKEAELGAFNADLNSIFDSYGYEDDVQQYGVYLPEGISRDDAIKGYFRETGRLMSEETMAFPLLAIDQAVATGGNSFVDATQGYTESSLNLAALNMANRPTDEYLDASGDYVKFLVSGEMNPIDSGLALPGAVLNYLGAATVDGIWDSIQTVSNEYAPRDARTHATANLVFEAAMSASGVGKAATAASKGILRASKSLVNGVRGAKYGLRSPVIWNTEAFTRLNSNPIDLIKGLQSPLVRRIDKTAQGAQRLTLNVDRPTSITARNPVDIAAQRRLNDIDLDRNVYAPGEAGAAAEMEYYLGGTLDRAPGGTSADFVVNSGDFAGARIDLKLTPDTFDQASKINQYFDKTFPKFSQSVANKLAKPDGVDLMPFDTRFLTEQNKSRLFEFVETLPASSQQKVIYLVQ